ncbi:uncharacterized [Tachysurus ichikawai]
MNHKQVGMKHSATSEVPINELHQRATQNCFRCPFTGAASESHKYCYRGAYEQAAPENHIVLFQREELCQRTTQVLLLNTSQLIYICKPPGIASASLTAVQHHRTTKQCFQGLMNDLH